MINVIVVQTENNIFEVSEHETTFIFSLMKDLTEWAGIRASGNQSLPWL